MKYKIKDEKQLYWLLYELSSFVDGEQSSERYYSTKCQDLLKKAYGEYPYNKQGRKDGYK